jgi:Uma2 family endonuclease
MATKTLITLEEFDALPDDGLRHELNRGELVTVTFPIFGHNRVIRQIYDILRDFLRTNPLGELFLPDAGFLLSNPGEPPTLRGPDLAYVTRERSAQIANSTKRAQGAPELVIEVVSPSDRPSELLEKVAQYLAAGGKLVWVFYPEEREVRVFAASGAMRILKGGDVIDAPELLPGFSAQVSAFFAQQN